MTKDKENLFDDFKKHRQQLGTPIPKYEPQSQSQKNRQAFEQFKAKVLKEQEIQTQNNNDNEQTNEN